MNPLRTVRYGSLDSYVVDLDGGTPPSVLVVLCHGYGAPGSDLVGVVGEWVQLLESDASRFRFLCPIAPHSLAELGMPDGRAWWPLNMARMMEAIQARRFDALHDETPPGLDESRAALSSLIVAAREELAQQNGCSPDAIALALGGFSQGAMLSMDTALRGDAGVPDYLMQFSGTVICQPLWKPLLQRLADTRVYQSHGTMDQILPFSSAERLRDLLSAAGIEAQFHAFDGPHTIDRDAVASTAMDLKRLFSDGTAGESRR